MILHELCTNLLRHGGGGKIFFEIGEDKIEIETINNNENFLLNKSSSSLISKGLGIGLKMVEEFSDRLDIIYEKNLKFRVTKFKKNYMPKTKIYVFSSSKTGNVEENGDGFLILHYFDEVILIVMDVLGHGRGAYEIKCKLIDSIKEIIKNMKVFDIYEIFENLNKTMHGTRGAAITIAKIKRENKVLKIEFLGIGNINSYFIGDKKISLISTDGILGEILKKPLLCEDTFEKGILVFHTDGVSSHHASLTDKEPLKILNNLLEYRKSYDDVCILIADFLK